MPSRDAATGRFISGGGGGAKLGTAVLELRTDQKAYDAGMRQAETSAKHLDQSFGGLKQTSAKLFSALKGVAAAYLGIQGIRKLASFVSDTTKAFEAQDNALTRLAVAVRENPVLSGDAFERLAALGGQLQKVTIFGDEQVQQALSFAAAAGLTEAKITRIGKVAADLASSGIMDYDSAVQQLTRTYTGLTGTLGRTIAGINGLTKEQLEQGKAVEIVEAHYRGMAEAMADTVSGVHTRAQNLQSDLGETIGGIFGQIRRKFETDVLIPALEKVNTWLSANAPRIYGVIVNLPELAGIAMEGVVAVIRHALHPSTFAEVLGRLALGIGTSIMSSFVTVSEAFDALLGEMIAMGKDFGSDFWRGFYKALLDIVGPLFDKLGLINLETERLKLQASGQGLEAIDAQVILARQRLADLEKKLADARKTFPRLAEGADIRQARKDLELLEANQRGLQNMTAIAGGPLLPAATTPMDRLAKAFGGFGTALFSAVWNNLKNLGETAKDVAGMFAGTLAPYTERLNKKIEGSAAEFEAYNAKVRDLADSTTGAAGAVGAFSEELTAFNSAAEIAQVPVGNYVPGAPVPEMDPALMGGGGGKDISRLGWMLNDIGEGLSSFGSELWGAIKGITSVSMILNPLSTILQAFSATLAPVVDKVLAPVVGALSVLGQALAKILIPVVVALSPIIEKLAQAFVWLYNNVLRPVGNAISTLFQVVATILTAVANAFIGIANVFLAKKDEIKYLKAPTINSNALGEISYEGLSASGASAIDAGSSMGAAATYQQQRPISVTIDVHDNTVAGDGSFRDLALAIKNELVSVGVLGYA